MKHALEGFQTATTQICGRLSPFSALKHGRRIESPLFVQPCRLYLQAGSYFPSLPTGAACWLSQSRHVLCTVDHFVDAARCLIDPSAYAILSDWLVKIIDDTNAVITVHLAALHNVHLSDAS